MIVLDNDIVTEFGNPNIDPAVLSYLQTHSTEMWIVPTIALYEYLRFYDSEAKQKQMRQKLKTRIDGIAPFNEDAAAEAAAIRAKLSSVGTSLDARDEMIAGIAREQGATLATRNKNDFDKTPIHQLMSVNIVR